MCLPAKFCPKYAVDIPDQAPSNATTLDWESFLWHTYFYFRMKTAKIIFLFSTKGMMSNQHLFLTNIEKKQSLDFSHFSRYFLFSNKNPEILTIAIVFGS